MKAVVIGTRGSQLALWQARFVQTLLQQTFSGLEVGIEVISTRGDRIQDVALPEIGGKGLFTAEIESALMEERIHLAVHSLKDLPSELPPGLELAGTPVREDIRDALVSSRWRNLEEIPAGAVLGTGSVRRRAQMRARFPGITFRELRGNIDTRLEQMERRGWDGIIMAAAALKRLGLQDRIAIPLDPEVFVPSVGQGAIGLEIKTTREDIRALAAGITDSRALLAVRAEREFMRRLQGGCSHPLGAWARPEGDHLHLTGYVSRVDGTDAIRLTRSGEFKQALDLAGELAEVFLEQGAARILTED